MRFFEKRPLCVSIAFFMGFLALSAILPVYAKIAVMCACAVGAAIILAVRRKFDVFCGILAALIAASAVSLVYFDIRVSEQKSYIGTSGVITAEVRKVNYSSSFSSYSEIVIREINGEKTDIKAKLECSYPLHAKSGEIVRLNGEVKEIENSDDTFDTRKYYNSKGFYLNVVSDDNDVELTGEKAAGVYYFFLNISEYVGKRLELYLDKDANGLVRAVFLGDKSDLSYTLKRDFRLIGISHILAVSGMHLSILMGGVYWFLRKTGISKNVRTVISILICLFYMGFTGAPASIIRSGIMFIILSLSGVFGRINDSPTSLFVAGGLITSFSPSTVFDAGFLLSFFATLGIVAVAPGIQKWKSKVSDKSTIVKLLVRAASPLIVTVAAVAFTLPFNFYYFGSFSPISPFTTLLFTPLVSILLFASPFQFAASFVPFLGRSVAFVINKVCALIVLLSSDISKMEFASFSLRYPFVKYLAAALCLSIIVLAFVKLKNEMVFTIPFAVFISVYFICRAVFLGYFDSYYHFACVNEGKNDFVCVYSEGKNTLIDISDGKKSAAKSAGMFCTERFYSETIDVYVFTHYSKYSENSFEHLSNDYIVKSVVLVDPITDKDRSYLSEIVDICYDKDIEMYRVGGDESVSIGDIAVKTDRRSISRSTHSVISCEIDLSGTKIVYAGRSFAEAFDDPECDILIAGANGPKQKKPCVYSPRLIGITSNDAAASLVNFDCGTVKSANTDGKCELFGIKK